MTKILQTLDVQDNCRGIYITESNQFKLDNFNHLLREYKIAWKHSPLLNDEEFQYVYPLLRGADLEDYSPDPGIYLACKNKIEAQQKASCIAKVNLKEECFFNLIPEHQLTKWFKVRHRAMESLLKIVKKDQDYEILHKAHVLTENIARQNIQFGTNTGRVFYNIFGSATGRLTTKKGSIPILTLKKEQREMLRPQNDAFVELDLNAAEIRMLLALSGREQPQGDIHEWILKTVFNSEVSRSQAKKELFAWLYNPSSSKNRFDQIFSRTIFRDFYFFENKVLTTPFGRKLTVEERKAQNYLLQSTTSDQVLENAYEIQKLLKDKKSKIAFTLHDSIILDISKEDAIMLKEIKSIFEQTRWGKFASTCKIGRNFGNLKELAI